MGTPSLPPDDGPPPPGPLACPDLRTLPLAPGTHGPGEVDDTPPPTPPPPQPPDDEPAPPLPGSNVSPPQLDADATTPTLPGVDAAARRAHRAYSDSERLGLCYLAIRDGVRPTAATYGMPSETLEGWLRHSGGLARVRSFIFDQAQAELLESARSVFRAVAERAPKLRTDELMQTYRRLSELLLIPAPTAGPARLGVGVDASAGVGAGGEGGPVARVTVRLVGDTGEEDIIQVDRGGRDHGEE